MKRKSLIGILLIVMFISINSFLIIKDDSHHVDRVTYINDWTKVVQKDMYEKLYTNGVLDYMHEELVYLDEDSGSFNEFLVEEGDEVSQGDELYSYRVQNYYEMSARLEEQKEQVSSDIDAVRTAIHNMQQNQITQDIYKFVYPDKEEAGSFKQNTSSAELMKEQYIIEKEKELAESEAKLKSIESQLGDLVTGNEIITVESPYEGKITNIATSLENPIIKIESPELYVIGELKENERMKVEYGMNTEVRLKENGQLFQGSVTELDEEPKTVTLNGTSIYPFSIIFSEEVVNKDLITVPELEDIEKDDDEGKHHTLTKEELLQGYHVDVAVTLKESLNSVVVPTKLVDESDSSIWLMTGDGVLVRQPIQTGIKTDGYVEVGNDVVEQGDWLAIDPKNHFHAQSTFITPLTPSNTNWKALYNNGARKRSILIGLLGQS